MKNQLIHKEFESPKPSISSRDRKAVQKSFKLASNNGDYSHNNSSVVLGNYVNSGYCKFVGNILVTNVSSVPVSIRKKKSRLYESPSPSKPKEADTIVNPDEYKMLYYVYPNVKRRKYKTRSISKRPALFKNNFSISANDDIQNEDARSSMRLNMISQEFQEFNRQKHNHSSEAFSNHSGNYTFINQSHDANSKESLSKTMVPPIKRFSKLWKQNQKKGNMYPMTKTNDNNVDVLDILYKEHKSNFKEDIEKVIKSPNLNEFISTFRKVKYEHIRKNKSANRTSLNGANSLTDNRKNMKEIAKHWIHLQKYNFTKQILERNQRMQEVNIRKQHLNQESMKK